MSARGQLLPLAPSFRDHKSLSAVHQIPAMPRIDSHFTHHSKQQ
jgi:hypothetical protein